MCVIRLWVKSNLDSNARLRCTRARVLCCCNCTETRSGGYGRSNNPSAKGRNSTFPVLVVVVTTLLIPSSTLRIVYTSPHHRTCTHTRRNRSQKTNTPLIRAKPRHECVCIYTAIVAAATYIYIYIPALRQNACVYTHI